MLMEHDPNHYLYFLKHYVRDVVNYEWLKIVAEDPRVHEAGYLMSFDVENTDRTREANLLAGVAEDYGLEDPEQMQQVLEIWESNLAHGYGEVLHGL